MTIPETPDAPEAVAPDPCERCFAGDHDQCVIEIRQDDGTYAWCPCMRNEHGGTP